MHMTPALSRLASASATLFLASVSLGSAALAQSVPAASGSVPSLASSDALQTSLMESPWPRSHRTPGQQAATPLLGPRGSSVEVRYFTEDIGTAVGTSPWHVLSSRKYAARPDARTLWGATLTHVYKYVLDGDLFSHADTFQINQAPLSVGWNLFRLPGDRIVVPNTTGLRMAQYRDQLCYGKDPSLLVFQDGSGPGSPIRCVHKFEFTKARLEAACGFRKRLFGRTGIFTGELASGHVAVSTVEKGTDRTGGEDVTHLMVLDPGLTRIVACAEVGPTEPSNQFAVESNAGQRTHVYFATSLEVAKMTFDPTNDTLRKSASAPLAFRERTGTAPTLVDTSDGRRWLVTVDGRCAVTNVFNGKIECSGSDAPSRLVAVDRADMTARPLLVDLPDYIDTVENSPAVSGNDVVVANYSGYSPDGNKDGRRDFARGVVKLRWDGRTFRTAWERPDVQISGVPTISSGSSLVYGSGAEVDGMTYFYGLDLLTGETRVRLPVGPSEDTSKRLRDAVFDAGNNTVINDDGSAVLPGGNTLVRVR